jgi:hypothetical protein
MTGVCGNCRRPEGASSQQAIIVSDGEGPAADSPAASNPVRRAAGLAAAVGMTPHPAAAAQKRHTQQRHVAQSAKLLATLAARS